jgi:tetratricopeptide (TPR) repeat protein
MFDKPFEQLFRAVQRVASQLASADREQRAILGEELYALRSMCDQFVEKWLYFEELVAELCETYQLNLEGTIPVQELHKYQQKLAELQPSSDTRKAAGKTGLPEEELSPSHWETFLQFANTLVPRPAEDSLIRSFRKGVGFYDLLMFEESVQELEKVVEMDSGFSMARFYLALGYLGKQDFEKSAKHLRFLAATETSETVRASVFFGYGHLHAEQGRFDLAAESFEELVAMAPDYQDAYYNLGVCYYNTGQLEKAYGAFRNSLLQNPDDWEAERAAGLIQRKLGRMDQALYHYQRAHELHPASDLVCLELADLCERTGNIGKAKPLYQRVLAHQPDSPPALSGLGWISLKSGHFGEAIALFKKQLSLHPGNRAALFNLGWALVLSQQFGAAEKCFEELLRRDPGNPYALTGLTRIWSCTGRRGVARETLLSMVRKEDPDIRKLSLFHLGRIYFEDQDYRQALKYFHAAVTIDKYCLESLFYKGLTHRMLGEKEEASQCWKQCRMLQYGQQEIVL